MPRTGWLQGTAGPSGGTSREAELAGLHAAIRGATRYLDASEASSAASLQTQLARALPLPLTACLITCVACLLK